jgi:ATP-dependent Clp protease ATP-binding subunit ClpA
VSAKPKLTKALANFLFDDRAMVRIDVSNIWKKHAVRGWSGANYVGYDGRGGADQTVAATAARLCCSTRWKRHTAMSSNILRVLDVASGGRGGRFRNTIIIVNLGSQPIAELPTMRKQ